MSLVTFIKSMLHEINPWHNFKLLNSNIRSDITAGITVGIIALPLALAFGEVSQLGPVAGIWGAIIGGVIGGLFGGSIVSVSGPTAPTSSQIATFMAAFIISATNQPDLTAIFSIIFLSGLIIIGISILNISKFIHYIPYSVVAGFMCGIGVIVILGQISTFFGMGADFSISKVNADVLFVSLPSLFIMLFWPKIRTINKIFNNIPAPLSTLIFGTLIAYFMNLDIVYIGNQMKSAAQNDLLNIYFPDFTRFFEFLYPALTLAGLVTIDSLLTCKIADNMIGGYHRSNQEVFGQGLANMVAGLCGGVSTATATMFTVSNIKFGGKTPLASIIYGLTLLSILFGLKFLVEFIPIACISAILLKVGIDIMDYRVLPILRKLPIFDIIIFIIVLIITVFGDLMIAVAIGVLLSIIKNFKDFRLKYKHEIFHISKSSFNLKIKNKETLKSLPISILEPRGSLFFGSIQSLLNLFKLNMKNDLLIIDMFHVNGIDLTSAYALEDFINLLNEKNIKVCLVNTNSNINIFLEKIRFKEKFDINNDKKSLESQIITKYKLD